MNKKLLLFIVLLCAFMIGCQSTTKVDEPINDPNENDPVNEENGKDPIKEENGNEKETFTIIFDAMNSSSPTTIIVEEGSKINSPADPFRDGYLFDGWYNGEVKWDFDSDEVTESMSLKARWIAIFDFEIVENYVVINGINKDLVLTDLVIPKTIDGYNVIKIKSFAFKDYLAIKHITIPNSVTEVGSKVFLGCENLEEIDCLATSLPSGWDKDWNPLDVIVCWWYEEKNESYEYTSKSIEEILVSDNGNYITTGIVVETTTTGFLLTDGNNNYILVEIGANYKQDLIPGYVVTVKGEVSEYNDVKQFGEETKYAIEGSTSFEEVEPTKLHQSAIYDYFSEFSVNLISLKGSIRKTNGEYYFSIEPDGCIVFGFYARIISPKNIDELDSLIGTSVRINGYVLYLSDQNYCLNMMLTSVVEEGYAPLNIEISGKDSMYVGAAYSIQLTASVTPAGASTDVIWISNNEKVAIVDENGVVTGLKQGTARIRAISAIDTAIASKFFVIKVIEYIEERPSDLQGYEIIIMNAASALGDIDPFREDYCAPDKLYKQEAWRNVEEMYNCKIKVVGYPEEATWGDKRIQWLITNAMNGTSECDLATIYSDWLPRFVVGRSDVIYDVTDYYYIYGEKQMRPVIREAASFNQSIYAASTGNDPVTVNVGLGLYYNVALLESLEVENPAKLFNEGKWTYSEFTKWVKNIQTKLSGAEGSYALSGHPFYYWLGLTNAAGVRVVDKNVLNINLFTNVSKDATAMMHELYSSGCVDPVLSWTEASIDNNAWFNGKAVMTTGYYDWVNNMHRWPSYLFGDDTRFGYVPFPYPDDMDKNDTRVSINNTMLYVFMQGREYPKGVIFEDIYRAINQMYLDTYKLEANDPEFNANELLDKYISNVIKDPESVAAIKFYDNSKAIYDSMYIIYSSPSAHPIKDAAINTMVHGKDYDEEFHKIFEKMHTDFKNAFGI